MRKISLKHILLVALLFSTTFLLSRNSHAYLSLKETAELLPDGIFKLGVAPQLKLSDGSGFNVGAYFDTSLSEDMNGRVEIGGGETDFWTAGSVKYVPFPDVGRQPAIGGKLALIYARDEKVNFYDVQFSPIISKLANTTYGKMIPFVGLPITWVSTKDDSFVSTQFAVGAEWFSNRDMHVGAELDLNLNKSFSSLTMFVSFPFDQSTGYKKK